MTPKYYADLTARAAVDEATGTVQSVSRLVFVLHGAFRTLGTAYALALPAMRTGELRHPGRVVRVFAETKEQLEDLLDNVEANSAMQRFIAGRIRQVPADFNGPWREYRRFRTPGRGTSKPEWRMKRLVIGDALPYFRGSSKSTGQVFSLRVQPLPAQAAHGIAECLPDSYGLSGCERPFALPELPVK